MTVLILSGDKSLRNFIKFTIYKDFNFHAACFGKKYRCHRFAEHFSKKRNLDKQLQKKNLLQ